MSISAYGLQTTGTPISWKPSGSGGDYNITCTSISNAAARQGAKGDLGANFARKWSVLFTTSVGASATNGTVIELWWSPSTSATAGTDNAGAASGTDAAYSTPAEYKLQLIQIGELNLSNAATTGVQKVWFTNFEPPTRYGSPIYVNLSGQTSGSTAADHEIRFVPIVDVLGSTITG